MTHPLVRRLAALALAVGFGTLVTAALTAPLAALPRLSAGASSTGPSAPAAGISFRIEAAVSGINDAYGQLSGSGIQLGDLITGTITYTADTPPPYVTANPNGGTLSYYDLHVGNPAYVLSVTVTSKSTGKTYVFSSAGLANPYLNIQVGDNLNGWDWLAFWTQGPFPSHWTRFDLQASCADGPVYVIDEADMIFADFEGLVLNGSAVPELIPRVSASDFDLGTVVLYSIIPSWSAYCPGQHFAISGDIRYVRPATINVLVDIKPESAENTINLGSSGAVPVAILGSATFDVSTVDAESLRLEGAAVGMAGKSGRSMCSFQDVNADGHQDLLCHFETPALDLEVGDSAAVLTGLTSGGTEIRGQDVVKIVPAK